MICKNLQLNSYNSRLSNWYTLFLDPNSFAEAVSEQNSSKPATVHQLGRDSLAPYVIDFAEVSIAPLYDYRFTIVVKKNRLVMCFDIQIKSQAGSHLILYPATCTPAVGKRWN